MAVNLRRKISTVQIFHLNIDYLHCQCPFEQMEVVLVPGIDPGLEPETLRFANDFLAVNKSASSNMKLRTILTFLTLCTFVLAEVPYEPFVDRGMFYKTALDHENVCQQPIESGICRLHLPRYGYNTTSKQCGQFVYRGCDANRNNFRAEGGCKRVCIDRQPCPISSLVKPKQGCRYNEELNDRDCPKYELVCDVKSGSCPTDHQRAHLTSACTVKCSHSDNQCPGEEKCCRIGCNIICVPPVPDNQ
uniref:Uncharacterized protein n=1 Tax=Romanomermis culicivorax TaxID=13658 RepID=A0A915K987_ROMCU